MTKVKVKGAFFHKSAPRPFSLSLISDHNDTDDEDEDQDEEEEEEAHEYEYGYETKDGHTRSEELCNFIPFGTVKTKQRGPRGGPRYIIHKDFWGHDESYSDSALATSSSERSSGDDDDDNEGGGGVDSVPSGSAAMTMGYGSARRGSVRPKVKPSKFREEGQLQANYTYATEVNSFSEKKKAPRKDAFAKDYTQEDELDASLRVLRKIMKMEAAEPFNTPVDPIALGIPDYFHIVKRPMDLGTICKHLERGSKYRTSQDVYEDVQLVWTNCRIYNQKGDPILDLLGRVKKNFAKYWTAAGLYTDKPSVTFKFQGRSLDALHSEYGVTHMKQMDLRDDIRSETANRTVNGDKLANSSRKCSGFTEQHATKRKATKIPPVEVASGLHGEQEAGFNILNDDLDTFFLNRGGPSIISVYKSHKKKKLEQQGTTKEHHLKVHIRDAERSPGNLVLKYADNANRHQYRKHVDSHGIEPGKYKGSDSYITEGKYKKFIDSNVTSKKYKDFDSHLTVENYIHEADYHGSPGKTRRVSGTGHHKDGCVCVVCSGVRRKLGREEKVGDLATGWTYTTEAPAGITPERLFLRLKTEHRNYGSKPIHVMAAAEETKDAYRTKKSIWEKREKAIAMAYEEKQGAFKKANSNEDFMDVTYEGDVVSDSAKADDATLGQGIEELIKIRRTKGYSGIAPLQLGTDRIQENRRGTPLEDAEDINRNEEHFGDILDSETYHDEGGVRYYRASYEMPLRKINPTILDMGQRLFGPGSTWNSGRSLGKRSIKTRLENPVLSSVSVLLSGK